MNKEYVIETNNLSKRFTIGTRERMTFFTTMREVLSSETPKKDIWAVKDISFKVKKGEMVAVIGPNGAGKTTLLRVLSGIMAPTSGEYITREEVSPMFELGLGFNPLFTAIQNIYLYGALHGLSRKDIERKLPGIIEFSGLKGFMHAKLREFSSGMRQRLAFATVMQTARGIIMVDEVLAVGDISFQKKCLNAFREILNRGDTILYVSHDIGSVRPLCSRALYLNRGQQRGYGPLPEMESLYNEDLREGRASL